jgi:hypothetical protein
VNLSLAFDFRFCHQGPLCADETLEWHSIIQISFLTAIDRRAAIKPSLLPAPMKLARPRSAVFAHGFARGSPNQPVAPTFIVLCIEEPETGLHPSIQKELLKQLLEWLEAFTLPVQCFVTTHSKKAESATLFRNSFFARILFMPF